MNAISHLRTGLLTLLLILAFTFGLAGNAHASNTQPPVEGWLVNPSNRHAYSVVAGEGISWSEAREEAKDLVYKGQACYLATLTSPQESAFIVENFSDEIGSEGFGFWLGGFQDATTQSSLAGWKWVTGEAWSYTDWSVNEPNDFHGPASEQYLAMWGSQTPGEQSWNDEALESNIKGYLVECGVVPSASRRAVQIDIRPGDPNNRINLQSQGALQVALLSSPAFSARDADPGSVRFGGAAPVHWRWVDIDRDGDLDLVLRFNIQALRIDPGATRASLTGRTLSGLSFGGSDKVKLAP